MPGSVTLHEEIAAILADSGVGWMTTAEIAKEVNDRGVYHKRDGSVVTAFQIHGRTRNYPHLFDRDGSRVRLGSNASGAIPSRRPASSPRLVPRLVSASGRPADELIDEALAELSQAGLTADQAVDIAPRQSGLYAIIATGGGLKGLGFGNGTGIVYVGKAEDSLESRDLTQHFSDGNTGRSTLRRSLAALLADALGLVPMPRNPIKPAHFDRYSLEPASDSRLTEWMRENLRLAFWAAPPGTVLRPIEIAVIRRLAPPLNLTDAATEHTSDIKARRRIMAERARAWVSSGH